MEQKPLFSIIIPTYNRADIIGRTIESALNQTYDHFEVIVVDDGSTDNTAEAVEKYKDKRLSYYKKENAERGAARNYGAQRAKGDYVYFLDSDDLLYPEHLKVAQNFLTSKGDISIFYQQCEITLENGGKKLSYLPQKVPINKELIKKGNFMGCQGVFIKKTVFLKHQFNEDRKVATAEDYELWLRLAARYPIHYSPTITSTLIEHADRSVLNRNPSSLIQSTEKMLAYLFEDEIVKKEFSKYKNRLFSEKYSYVSLHLALSGDKKQALQYLWKSLKHRPAFIFRRRFLAILKHLVF